MHTVGPFGSQMDACASVLGQIWQTPAAGGRSMIYPRWGVGGGLFLGAAALAARVFVWSAGRPGSVRSLAGTRVLRGACRRGADRTLQLTNDPFKTRLVRNSFIWRRFQEAQGCAFPCPGPPCPATPRDIDLKVHYHELFLESRGPQTVSNILRTGYCA